jgi:hypothetical protein
VRIFAYVARDFGQVLCHRGGIALWHDQRHHLAELRAWIKVLSRKIWSVDGNRLTLDCDSIALEYRGVIPFEKPVLVFEKMGWS